MFVIQISRFDFKLTPCSESCIFFFWIFPRRQISFFFIKSLKMDLTEDSETSAQLNLTPGKYPQKIYKNITLYVAFCIIHGFT
jgi:hypothetical protein